MTQIPYPPTATVATQLPRLPLPSLPGTCRRYLEIVSPWLSTAVRQRTERAVAEFQMDKGPALQAILEERAKTTATSYLHEIYQAIYLQNRLPLPLHQNCAGVMEPIVATSTLDRAALAAAALVTVANFYLCIQQGQLPPDKLGNRALCMQQYQHLFATTRLPGAQQDSLRVTAAANHVVVGWQHAFYVVQVIDQGRPLPVVAIKAQIDWIMQQQDSDCPAVGLLTALPRGQWATYRQALTAQAPANSRCLQLIDEALCLLALDEVAPPSQEAAAAQALSALVANRWYDKSLQLIIMADGRIGVNMEHSGVDGTPLIRFGIELKTHLAEFYAQCHAPSTPSLGDLPRPLRWQLSPQLASAIAQAAAELRQNATPCHTRHLIWAGFGARLLTEHGLDPDAVVQLALQLTYAQQHQQLAMAYEPVQMRHFRFGRTDGMRTSTAAAVAFVQHWRAGATDERLWAALVAATRSHQQQMTTCLRGHGVDKHLFALYALAVTQGDGAQSDLPAIFRDPAYTEYFCQPTLVTSCVPAFPGLELFCFGPSQTPASYSVAYLLHEERITFCTTSREPTPDCFMEALCANFADLAMLIERQAPSELVSARIDEAVCLPQN